MAVYVITWAAHEQLRFSRESFLHILINTNTIDRHVVTWHIILLHTLGPAKVQPIPPAAGELGAGPAMGLTGALDGEHLDAHSTVEAPNGTGIGPTHHAAAEAGHHTGIVGVLLYTYYHILYEHTLH